MSEIKPVAWRYRDSELLSDWDWHFLELPPLLRYSEVQALYDQSAIDTLLKKIDRLEMIESSWMEFMDKTDCVQTASEPHELGKHRADVMKDRIDRLTADRDSAVADARQLRDFADIDKNFLIAAAKRARRCLAWACEQRPEFNAEYEALDAAIDAAMNEQKKGK